MVGRSNHTWKGSSNPTRGCGAHQPLGVEQPHRLGSSNPTGSSGEGVTNGGNGEHRRPVAVAHGLSRLSRHRAIRAGLVAEQPSPSTTGGTNGDRTVAAGAVLAVPSRRPRQGPGTGAAAWIAGAGPAGVPQPAAGEPCLGSPSSGPAEQ